MQDHAADELHVEMAHVQEPPTRFAGQRKRRDQNRLEGLLHQVAEGRFGGVGVFEGFLNLLFQLEKAKLQIFVAERFDFGLEGVNSRDIGLQFFDVALVLGADKSRDYAVNNLRCIHECFRRFLTVFDCAGDLQVGTT